MFRDRIEAGKKLDRALKAYKGKKVIVLAIPRGGVEPAYYVAKALGAPLSLLVVRKLPLPHNTEAGFGAIVEDGTTYYQPGYKQWVKPEDIKKVKKEQRAELKRRVKVLRGKPLPSLKGKIVILVDDGIAMGSTLIAAIKACKKLGAKKIIAASPVSSKEVALNISKLVDELIVLETPDDFYAVAQVYYYWHDATDEEVNRILKKYPRAP
jgi:predicted phosphoribosyltransferase